MGTAGPLKRIVDLPETFLVMNGDLLTDLDYGEIMRRHTTQANAATIGVYRKEVRIDLGVLEHDGEGHITVYREKPTLGYDVSMGVYVFSREVLAHIPDGYFDFPDLVLELIRQRRQIRGFPFNGLWLDIGRAEDYAKAIETFERERKRFLPGG